MDFITIDFETADVYRDSPCEIGLTFVENNKIVETKSWLIKPHCWPNFSEFTTRIHGIEPHEVADAPSFIELWDELHPLIKGKNLIAHNASFDFSVLRSVLDYYDLEYPELQYACSYIFSKQAWPNEYSYALNYLCKKNGIDFNHHSAGDDSRATAELALKVFRDLEVNSFEEITEKLTTRIGTLRVDGYSPCQKKREYNKIRHEPV